MNIISKCFPHPVLGLSDDITGGIKLDIEIERNQINKSIVCKIVEKKIDNNYFNKLISDGEASILFKVYCSSTFKTFSFINPPGLFEINENDVCNKLEIEPLIISTNNISSYFDNSFNEEFDNQKFEVNKYDIIGVLGKITVPLDHKYEKLGIGNLFVFEPNDDFSKPLSFELGLDKIYIKYPPTKEGEHPPNAMFHKNAWSAFNIFIVPALEEAFRIMGNPDQAREAEHLEWFQVLDDILPESERDPNPFINAQLILNREIPLLKAYEELCKN